VGKDDSASEGSSTDESSEDDESFDQSSDFSDGDMELTLPGDEGEEGEVGEEDEGGEIVAIDGSVDNRRAFYLVRVVERDGVSGACEGQYLGTTGPPFVGPYRLAWRDPKDGMEVHSNTRRKQTHKPVLAEFTRLEVIARHVVLDRKQCLPEHTAKRIAFRVPGDLMYLVPRGF
jgi:hypothetical protein